MISESSTVGDPKLDTQLRNKMNAFVNLINEVRARMCSLDEGLGEDVSSSLSELLTSPQPLESTDSAAVVKLIEAHPTAMGELGSLLLEMADKGASLSQDLNQTADINSEAGPEKSSTREGLQTPYTGIPAKAPNDAHEGADSMTQAEIRSFSPDALALKDAFDRFLGEDSTNNPKVHFGRIPEDELYKK